MPDFTGFDFIQSLKNPPKIILIHWKRHAARSFEYECDYFRWPITEDRFQKQFKSKLLQKSAKDIGSKPTVEDNANNFD
jgi:hypothetical protein